MFLSVFSEYYSKEYINAQVKSEIYKGLLNQSLKGKTDFKNELDELLKDGYTIILDRYVCYFLFRIGIYPVL